MGFKKFFLQLEWGNIINLDRVQNAERYKKGQGYFSTLDIRQQRNDVKQSNKFFLSTDDLWAGYAFPPSDVIATIFDVISSNSLMMEGKTVKIEIFGSLNTKCVFMTGFKQGLRHF